MKIDRINYQKTFNLGNYTSERIGVEAEVEQGQDLMECYQILKDYVEKFHKDNNPQIVEGGGMIPFDEISINRPLPTIDRKYIEAKEILIDKINEAGSQAELEKISWADIEKYFLTEHYQTKLQQLQP